MVWFISYHQRTGRFQAWFFKCVYIAYMLSTISHVWLDIIDLSFGCLRLRKTCQPTRRRSKSWWLPLMGNCSPNLVSATGGRMEMGRNQWENIWEYCITYLFCNVVTYKLIFNFTPQNSSLQDAGETFGFVEWFRWKSDKPGVPTMFNGFKWLRNWPVHLDVYWLIWRSFWNWPWY